MAEHTLILLRHAKSDWSGFEADHDRPLARRGRRQAPEAGRWLAGNVDRIDLAVVSTATRARTTWDLVAEELDQPPHARYDDDAYMAATAIGDSGTPGNLDRDDFIDGQYPHIPAGTNVLITLDHDGASGTAAQNVQIFITFLAD